MSWKVHKFTLVSKDRRLFIHGFKTYDNPGRGPRLKKKLSKSRCIPFSHWISQSAVRLSRAVSLFLSRAVSLFLSRAS